MAWTIRAESSGSPICARSFTCVRLTINSIKRAATITAEEVEVAHGRAAEERADARAEIDRAFAESQVMALALITISPARVYTAGCASGSRV